MKRNKQIGAVLLALGITFITGCGGSNGGSDKKYVLIMHDSPSGVCEAPLFIDSLEREGFKDFDTHEYGNNTKDCWNYPNSECREEWFDEDLDGAVPADCVIRFNGFSGYGKKVGTSDFSREETTWAEKATSAMSASIE